jgi:hypothetical protein
MPFLSSNLRRCEQYPEEALCEVCTYQFIVVLGCHSTLSLFMTCPGDTHYVTFCYCDFYAFADTVGYKSEKMAGWWVLPKSISVVWSKRNTVTIRRFYCCTCSTSETFLSQISSAETDLFGLNLLYQNLGGNFWLNNEDRVTPNPHWDWYGVECTDGHVTSLKLNGNNLTGDISFFGKGEDVGEDFGDTI